MKAILSDIHGNLEALQAVLDDARKEGAGEIYCLGDTVNYGPNPLECLDIATGFSLVLLGNHEQAVLFEPGGFGTFAQQGIFWTRSQFELPTDELRRREARWCFLAELRPDHREGDFLFVHGSPRNPLTEFVFPEDIYNKQKMDRSFALVEKCCFQGHSHVPGVFTENVGEDSYSFTSPEEMNYQFKLVARKILCNVGSVGQPRDGDWRACYVLFDGETIYYRRVEYDVDSTIRKIYDIPDLDNYLGDRLRDGR